MRGIEPPAKPPRRHCQRRDYLTVINRLVGTAPVRMMEMKLRLCTRVMHSSGVARSGLGGEGSIYEFLQGTHCAGITQRCVAGGVTVFVAFKYIAKECNLILDLL